MITAVDPGVTDTTQTFGLSSTASLDTNLFAAQLAQALSGSNQGQSGAASSFASGNIAADPSAALAFQVAQLQAAQSQTQTQDASATQQAQPALSESQQKSLYDSAVLQNLNFQASVAMSQGNVFALNTLEMMINKQMQDMGLVPQPATQTTASTANAQAAATTATATKTTTKKTTSTTTAKTSTKSTATASSDAASNASTSSSSSAALEDQVVSNAGTGGVVPASNSGITGDTTTPDEPLVDDSWQAAVNELSLELETLLAGMDENERSAALAGMQGLMDDLAELSAGT